MKPAGIVLIGLRRSGKTTVGELLARRLERDFIDLDQRCAILGGLPVAEIIRRLGEPRFREVERQAMRQTLAEPGAVLAVGGGTPVNADCGALIKSYGIVLYLHARPDVLFGRASGEERPADRPLLVGSDAEEEVAIHYAKRDPAFRELADAVIDADSRLGHVVERCELAIQSSSV